VKSLNFRLSVFATLSILLVVGLAGVLLYGLIEEDLEDEFDRSLLDRARSQAALVEFDEEGLQFEWEHSPELVRAGAVPRYFQVRSLDGKLLAHSRDLSDADFDYPRVYKPGEGNDDSDTSIDGKRARVVTFQFTAKVDDEAEGVPPKLLLIVAEPTNELESTLKGVVLRLEFAGMGAFLVALVLLRLILWRELRPLRKLAEEIAELDENCLNRRVEIKSAPSELRPVIQQLNLLLARVDHTLRREHEFTAGAAHELRTPLAGLRAKLELALSRERTPEQHREFTQSELEITLQMQALIENLLNLARAGASAETPAEIDLREALRAAWKPHAEQAEKRGLKVDWEFIGEKANVPPNALALIAGNLFENAVSYTNEGGRIEIAAEATANGLKLEVANTGCNLQPGQTEQVFEPFWRADMVRTVGSHAGLGLAISRRVARKVGGDITVQIIKDRFIATAQL
jgi:two-component system, OmpR family, heavy metal sensor histidine kinase CusS